MSSSNSMSPIVTFYTERYSIFYRDGCSSMTNGNYLMDCATRSATFHTTVIKDRED